MKILFVILLVVVIGLIVIYHLTKIQRRQLPKDKVYNFDGAQMSYSVVGRGKSVILLHGSMISDPWNGFENELSKSYQVYLPHLPGFGASDAVNGKLNNTELFSESLCEFVKVTKLAKAPVIAFSLGTVVAVKSASGGCLEGKLVLVGMPAKVDSEKLKQASLIPVWFRRIIVSTFWGRDKILIPVLRDIIGVADKKRDNELLEGLAVTDTRSLVDLDVYKEIELKMSDLVPKLKNETFYVYGEKDKLIDSTRELARNPIFIEGADHNVFRSQPGKMLKALKTILQ